jgi:hypothetical protein
VSVVYEIGKYLSDNVSDLTLGTNLFLGDLPDQPDVSAAVFETTSVAPTMTFGGTGIPQMERPNVMVWVRHTSYSSGRAIAEKVWQKLSQIANESLTNEDAGTTLYQRVDPLGSPALMHRDEQRRVVFTINFETHKVLSTTV